MLNRIVRALGTTAVAATLAFTAACTSDHKDLPDTDNPALGVVKAMQESGTADITGPFDNTTKAETVPGKASKDFNPDSSKMAASWTSKSTDAPSLVEKHSDSSAARMAVLDLTEADGRQAHPTQYAYFNGPWVIRLNKALSYDQVTAYVAQFQVNTGTFDDKLSTDLPSKKTCQPLAAAFSKLTLDKHGAETIDEVLGQVYLTHLTEVHKLDSVGSHLLDMRALAVAIYLSNINDQFTDKPQQEFVAAATQMIQVDCAYALGNSTTIDIKTTLKAG